MTMRERNTKRLSPASENPSKKAAKPDKETSDVKKKVIRYLKQNTNMIQSEIAQATGFSEGRISQILKEHRNDPDVILFTQNKDKAYEGLEAKIFESIEDEDIKKATLQQRVLAMGLIHDKIQALRGQASSVTLHDIRVLIETRPNSVQVEGNGAVPLLEASPPDNINVIHQD